MNNLIFLSITAICIMLTACSSQKTVNSSSFVEPIKLIDENQTFSALAIVNPHASNPIQFCFPEIIQASIDSSRIENPSCSGINVINLATFTPVTKLEENYAVCAWGETICERGHARGSEKAILEDRYNNAMRTGLYEKKIIAKPTILKQTLGQLLFFYPLMTGVHDVKAEFSDEKLNEVLTKATANNSLTELRSIALANYMEELERVETSIAQEKRLASLRESQEEQRIAKTIKDSQLKQINMQDRWKDAVQLKKIVGDKICTFKGNRYGYVEKITANGKIQVRQIGIALYEKDGMFFGGKHGQFTFNAKKPSTPLIWVDEYSWGKCFFETP